MSLLLVLLRADARRPSSWMTLAAALVVGWGIAGGSAAGAVPAAWLCGAALAVAAIGAPRPDAAAPLLDVDAWAGARVAWPALGAIAGTLLRAVSGSAGTDAAVLLLATLLGAFLTGKVRIAAAPSRGEDADATSLALALAGTAAFFGWRASDVSWPSWPALATTLAAFGILAGAARAVAVPIAAGGGGGRPAAGVPAAATLGNRLVAASMVVSLLGMVWWLFLDPGNGPVDLWMSLWCFLAVGVPPAVAGTTALDPRSRALAASMPARRGRQPAASRGGAAEATPSVRFHAAVIAWPALVASVLLLGDPARAVMALGIAVAVGLAAVVTALLADARLPLGSADTRQALAMVLGVGVAVAALG